jgi:hypothetical protein
VDVHQLLSQILQLANNRDNSPWQTRAKLCLSQNHSPSFPKSFPNRRDGSSHTLPELPVWQCNPNGQSRLEPGSCPTSRARESQARDATAKLVSNTVTATQLAESLVADIHCATSPQPNFLGPDWSHDVVPNGQPPDRKRRATTSPAGVSHSSGLGSMSVARPKQLPTRRSVLPASSAS